MATLNHLKKGDSLEDKQLILINSDDRDINTQGTSSFTYTFNKPIKRVSKMDVIYTKIPNTFYNINNDNASMSITTKTFTDTKTDILVIDDNEIKLGKIQATNFNNGNIYNHSIIASNNNIFNTKTITKNSFLFVSGVYYNNIDLKNQTGSSSNKQLYNLGMADLFIARYSLEQEFQMRFRIGGVLNDTDIQFDVSDSDIFITGVFSSFSLSFYNSDNTLATNVASNSNISSFLAKYSIDGQFQWCLIIEGIEKAENPTLLSIDEESQLIYLTGTFSRNLYIYNKTDELQRECKTVYVNNGTNIFLLQYSFNGVLNWINTTITDSTVRSLAFNNRSSNVFIGIEYRENAIIKRVFPTIVDNDEIILNGLQNLAVIEFNKNGYINNSVRICGSNFDSNIQITISNSIMAISGFYQSNPLCFYDQNTYITLDNVGLINNLFVAHYNITDGITLNWCVNIYEDIESFKNTKISISNNDDVILTGDYKSNLRFNDINGYVRAKDLLNSGPNTNAFLASYSKTGVLQYRSNIATTSGTDDACYISSIDAHSNNIYITGQFKGASIKLNNSDDTDHEMIYNQNPSKYQGFVVSYINNTNDYLLNNDILDKTIISRNLIGNDISYILNYNAFSQQLGLTESTQFRSSIFGSPINWPNGVLNITSNNNTITIIFIIGDLVNKVFKKYTYLFQITNSNNYTPFNMAYEVNNKLLALLKQQKDFIYTDTSDKIFLYDSVKKIFYINIFIEGTFKLVIDNNINILAGPDGLNLTSNISKHCVITSMKSTPSLIDNSKLIIKVKKDMNSTICTRLPFNKAFPNLNNINNTIKINAQLNTNLILDLGVINDSFSDLEKNDNITFDSPWISEDKNKLTFLYPIKWTSLDISTDGLTITTVATNGNIYTSNNGGQIWYIREFIRNWKSVSMTDDAKYQTAIVKGGQIYTSDNYGENWSPKDSDREWQSISVSRYTGQYQIASTINDTLYISSDYGKSWLSRGLNKQWISTSISGNGQYQSAVSLNDYIYVSSDYGNNWTQSASLGEWKYISMSNSGQFQSAIQSNTYVFHSTNYGINWTMETVKNGVNLDTIKICRSDGVKKIISGNAGDIYYSDGINNTWVANNLHERWSDHVMDNNCNILYALIDSGNIYKSANQGVEWLKLTELNDNKVWRSCCISDDGRFQLALTDTELYTSVDAGNIWTKNNNLITVNGVSLDSVIKISANGKYIYCYIYSRLQRSDDFGNTWSIVPLLSNVFSVSSNGKYVTLAQGNNLHVSTDYGLTFVAKSFGVNSPQYIYMSFDGFIQYCFVVTPLGTQKKYISKNIWDTWEVYTNINVGLQSIKLSYDYKFQMALNPSGFVYISLDYGNTWNAANFPYLFYYFDFSYDASFIVIYSTNGGVFMSYDYGNTWVNKEGVLDFIGLSMSSNGSHILAITNYNSIYNSNDFGNSWYARKLIFTSDNKKKWSNVNITNGGKTIISLEYIRNIYISYDSGYAMHSMNIDSTAYRDICTSVNGQIIHIIGIGGEVFTSSNGADFTFVGFPGYWWGIDTNESGNITVICGANNNTTGLLIQNGIGNPWVEQTIPISLLYYSILSVAVNRIGDIIYVNTSTKVYKFINNEWNECYSSGLGIIGVACDSTGDKVTISTEQGIFITTDGFNTVNATNGPTGTPYVWANIKMSYDGNTHMTFRNDKIFISYDDWNTYFSPVITASYSSISMDRSGIYMAASTENGNIYKSFNRGENWGVLQSNRHPISNSLSGDGNTQTIISHGREIYNTNNKGKNWNIIPITNNWRDINICKGVSSNQIAVPCYGYIYVSENNGVNWTEEEAERYWSCCACGNNIRLVAELNGRIYIQTKNITWSNWSTLETNRQWQSIAVSQNGNIIAAVVKNGQIHISKDMGLQWNTFGSNKIWQKVAMSSDGTKIIAIEYGGKIHFSLDTGDTWTEVEENRFWHSIAISADGTKSTAVAMGGQIYYSYNSNLQEWKSAGDVNDWVSVDMNNDGDYQTVISYNDENIYFSTDYGQTWFVAKSIKELSSIAISDDGKMQTVSENGGTLYVSNNSGNSWKQINKAKNWNKVVISLDGKYQISTTNDKQVYYSINFGVTWIEYLPINYDSVIMSSLNHVIFYNYKESNFIKCYIDDAGISNIQAFNTVENIISIALNTDGQYFTAITSSGAILLWSDYGNVIQTNIDFIGYKWTDISMSYSGNIMAITSTNNRIFISINGGNTWLPKSDVNKWYKIKLSATGVSMIAIVESGKLCVSSDTGNTWTYVENNNQWRDIAINGNGDFQIACNLNNIVYHPFNVNQRISLTVENIYKDYQTTTAYMTNICDQILVKLHNFNLSQCNNFTLIRIIEFPVTDIFVHPSNYTPQQLIDRINYELQQINAEYINPYGFSYDPISQKVSFNSKYSGNVLIKTDLLNSLGFSSVPSAITANSIILANNVIDNDFNGPRNLFIKSDIIGSLRKNKTAFSKNKKIENIIAPLEFNDATNIFKIPFPMEIFLNKKETIEKIDIQVVDEYGNIINLNGGFVQVNFQFYTS